MSSDVSFINNYFYPIILFNKKLIILFHCFILKSFTSIEKNKGEKEFLLYLTGVGDEKQDKIKINILPHNKLGGFLH